MTDAADLLALARLDVEVWFSLFGRIKTKEGKLIRAPKPNVVQRRLFAAYRRCRVARRPFKALGLKPRQVGLSTGAQAIAYHHNQSFDGLNGTLMADKSGTSDKVFEIYRTFAEGDEFDWKRGRLAPFGSAGNLTDEIILPNGSRYGKETAGSARAGAGGTVQVVVGTEVAHFPKAEGKDPALGMLNAWYDEGEMSLGIFDTTPNGPHGLFFTLWQDKNNGYERIFAAWFEFPEHALQFEHPDERAKFAAELEDDEIEEQLRYGVTLEQLKWRRKTIKDKCQGDVQKFRQEYPSNDVECFLLSSRLCFRAHSVDAMKKESAMVKPEKGDLQLNGDGDRVSWRPCETGSVEVIEQPRVGCRYIIAADTCTGEDQQQGGPQADPDYHEIGAFRAGYIDPNGAIVPPRLVALHSSRLDADLAAHIARCMSLWYGGCEVIPEVNNSGLLMVKRLIEWGVAVFHREHTNKTAGIREKHAGWRTDAITRKTIIDNLKEAVRDWKREAPTIEVPFDRVTEQLGKFVINENGKPEAMPGSHDDTVLMLAIGLYNLSRATEMKLMKRKPMSVEKLLAREGWRRA